ncbi:hypothetical protein L7F22_064423 [Adiantum nelumboides]|nr:hypothetical protein [Adiantum nelumboides]
MPLDSSIINPQEPNMAALLSYPHVQEITDLISSLHTADHGNLQLPFRQRYELSLFAQMLADNIVARITGNPIGTCNLPPPSPLCCAHGEGQMVSVDMLESSLRLVDDEYEDAMPDFVSKVLSRLQVDFVQKGIFEDEQDKDGSFHAWAESLVSVIDMILVGEPISSPEHKQLLAGLIQAMNDLLTDMECSGKKDDKVSDDVTPHELDPSDAVYEDLLRETALELFDSTRSIDPQHKRVLTALMEKSTWQQRLDLVQKLDLHPPKFLRLIDCKSSVQQGQVILVDLSEEMGYTALSHTYGMGVYEVFDCPCASDYRGAYKPRCNPALNCCAMQGGEQTSETSDVKVDDLTHKKVVGHILRMCETLLQNGLATNYIWHDGVCIAQFDASEVQQTIEHMGWIYANAFETVIFLQYAGAPMAPIRPDGDLVARWHTRVWTLQEAVLSPARRYCVRLGHNLIGDDGIKKRGQTFAEFKANLAAWYEEETSTVCVLEEKRFLALVVVLMQAMPKHPWSESAPLGPVLAGEEQSEEAALLVSHWLKGLMDEDTFLSALLASSPNSLGPSEYQLASDEVNRWIETSVLGRLIRDRVVLDAWRSCLHDLYEEVVARALRLPDLESALEICSNRESKHEGDRINSILALAEVKDFTAAKDDDLEKSTIEFLKRQGKKGLASAIFLTNIRVMAEGYDTVTGEKVVNEGSARTVENVSWGYTRVREHTWVPNLSLRLQAPEIAVMGKQVLDMLLDGRFTKVWWQQLENFEFEVVEDDNLQCWGAWNILEVELSFVQGNVLSTETAHNISTSQNQTPNIYQQPAREHIEGEDKEEEEEEGDGILPLELLVEDAKMEAYIVRDPVSSESLGRALFPLAYSQFLRGSGDPLLPDAQDCYFYTPMDAQASTLALIAFPHDDNYPLVNTRALVLEYGDVLASPVAKLGSLTMNKAFHQLLINSQVPLTPVDGFVIR